MTLTFQTKSGEFKVDGSDSDETVLFTGLSAGLSLPYECATGTCGTCRARVMSGDYTTVWAGAPGAKRLKAEKGDVLMCQTRADGDCVLRVPANVAAQSGRANPQRRSGRIVDVRRLTADVIHFETDLEQTCPFSAGQFMVATAPGVSGGRAYSMVNYDPATSRLVFVVKRKPGGGFSDWLFDEPRMGETVSLFGPLGKATFRPDTDGDLICITGGSGIAGILSILDHATSASHFTKHSGTLFFGVRTLADAFYLEELSSLVDRASGGLAVTLALSDEDVTSSSHPTYPAIRLATGFVHEVAARALSACEAMPDERCVGFLAGPPPMVDGGIRVLLAEGKLTPGQIRYDKFG